uniref:F-box/LRR-repeat protein 7 n=1 Tax=Lygus hesperus TaxID=30085 RepID=A0A0A9ZEI6_LYGHE
MHRVNNLYVLEKRGCNHRGAMDPHYDGAGKFFTTVDGVPVRKLFVGNLPTEGSYNLNHSHLASLFQPYGTVVNISLVQKPEAKPFAFVTFLTPQDAAQALLHKGQISMSRRKLYLSPADSWHQPIELPSGEIVWDRRKQEPKEDEAEFADAEEEDCSESASTANDEVALIRSDEPTEEEDDLEVESCPIDKLNDDCLQLIFELIPVPERLTLSRVCRRWRELISYYWKSFKKLDFTTQPLDKVVLTDKKLNYFLHLCPNVTSLNIAQDDNDLTSEAIVVIAKTCKDLDEIHMRNITIQKRSLAYLANSCPKLKSFSMDACNSHHDGEMSSLVKKSKNLECISLKYGAKTSGFWLKQLQSPLRSLLLEMYEFNPENLIDGIARVKSTLRELSFVSCSKLRNQDLLKIVQMCPDLTRFSLSGMVSLSLFDPFAIYPITQLSKLEILDLEHNRMVSDKFMQSLVDGCPVLRHLNISGIENTELTERGLSLLVNLPQITHLRMACIKVNDSLLKNLSKKLKLKHLDIMGCQNVTDEGCIEILNNCPQLESLDLAGCVQVTNETILAAVNILSNDPSRKKLNIVCGNTQVKEEPWFHENDVMKRLNVDLNSTIIANFFDDIYQMDSDMENSEESFDDYDVYEDYNHYYDSDSDMFDLEEDDMEFDLIDIISNDFAFPL